MNTFAEFEAFATRVPLSLRNNRDRVELPVIGLQEEAGKVGSLLAKTFASGNFTLAQEQTSEVKDRMADILWFLALLCSETGIAMQGLAAHSVTQLKHRRAGLDPDRR